MTELETSARRGRKRMTNHNTPQLSGMDSANHCAAFPGLSALSITTIRAVAVNAMSTTSPLRLRGSCNFVVMLIRLWDCLLDGNCLEENYLWRMCPRLEATPPRLFTRAAKGSSCRCSHTYQNNCLHSILFTSRTLQNVSLSWIYHFRFFLRWLQSTIAAHFLIDRRQNYLTEIFTVLV
jgi:hypothetical protein